MLFVHGPGTLNKLVLIVSHHQHYIFHRHYFYLTGIAKRQATWMLGGEETGRALAGSLLSSGGNIVDMGNDVGAANVVKLCGNFLIAVSLIGRLFMYSWLITMLIRT